MNEQRAREAVEHLQTAALEVIASLRAFLDVAESVVRDPAQAANVAGMVGDLAGTAERVTRIHVS